MAHRRLTISLASFSVVLVCAVGSFQTADALPFLASHANQRWPLTGGRLHYLALHPAYSDVHRASTITFPFINPAEVEQRLGLTTSNSHGDEDPKRGARFRDLPIWLPFPRRGDVPRDYAITLTPQGAHGNDNMQAELLAEEGEL